MTQNNTVKAKRPRIKTNLPTHTSTVDFRLKKIKAELGEGLTKFELTWLLIQNDLKALNNH